MAVNKNLSKLEQEEKDKALSEAVSQRAQMDRDLMAQVFGSAEPTMDAVRNPDPNQPGELKNDNRFTSQAPVQEVPEFERPSGYRGATPGAYTGYVAPAAYDPSSVDAGVPLQLAQPGVSTVNGVPVEVEEVDAVVPQQSVLRQNLDKLNVNQTAGVAPDVAQKPDAVAETLTVQPVSDYGSEFNRLEVENGLPLGFLLNTAQLESGMDVNAKNPNSSAKGLFQFIDKTAEEFGLKDPMDPAQSTEAMIKLTKRNQAHLTKVLGREPTGEELYLAHQQGATGALKVIQSDANGNAVALLGKDHVLKNGGNEQMTVGEFKNLWGSKYNKISGNVQPISDAPVMEKVVSVDDYKANTDKGVGQATSNGVNPMTAEVMSNIQLDKDGRALIKADEGLNFDGDFQHRNREVSDSGALWQGLLAGGIAVLGTALAGGKGQDLGAAFALGAGGRFINAMNESHRYKNLDALKKQGYTAESIEAYIGSGDRSQLAKHKIGEWKEYPDGSGRMMRTLPNGDTELRAGTPKWTAIKNVDENGVETTTYWNDFHGQRTTKDANGNEVPFSHITGRTKTKDATVASKATVFYDPKDSTRSEVEVLQKGDTWVYANNPSQEVSKEDLRGMRIKPEAGKDGKQAKTQADLAKDAESSKRLLTKIDETVGKLQQGNASGLLDGFRGGVYQFTGNTFFGNKNAGEVKSNIEKLQRDLIADVKHLFGPSISNSDIIQMLGFDLLDPFKDEAHNIRQLGDIRGRIEGQLSLVNNYGMDGAEQQNRQQLDANKDKGGEKPAAYSYSNNTTTPNASGVSWRNYGS